MWRMCHLISPSGYHQCNGDTNSIYLLRLLGGLSKIMYVKCFEQTGIYSFCVSFCCFCSVAQSCLTLCDPMNCSMPDFPIHHQLPELAQTQVHQVSDSIQPFIPLLPSSPFPFNLFQHQGLFQWVGCSHQVAQVLEFQLQHQSFQWIFRVHLL